MEGSLDSALGLGWEVWLYLSILTLLTLFFKFGRFWSVRNLDLLLLFVMAPGMLMILGRPLDPPLSAYIWLFSGSGLWLLRCLLDLGLSRRPLLEPNLNASGLLCLSVGVLGLLLTETVLLPVEDGAARNPAERSEREERPAVAPGANNATVRTMLSMVPLPTSLKRQLPQVIASRVLAVLAHLTLVVGLLGIGWKLFERPITGVAMATCYLVLPYTRMELVDSGQLISSALIVAAVFWYARPALAGVLIGLAAGWIPACIGLIATWCGFYRGRGAARFTIVASSVVTVCALLGRWSPGVAPWARALGARSIVEVGLLPHFEPVRNGSFWSSIDSSFRLPVLIAYLLLAIGTMFWPAEKSLAELISMSGALLVASQFWYLDKGGALVMLYLPLAIAMMFRPTLATRRPSRAALRRRITSSTLNPSP